MTAATNGGAVPAGGDDSALGSALRLIDDAWEELRRTVFVQQLQGVRPTRLPDLSFAEAERKSAVGRALVARAEAIATDRLPHDVALSVRLVRYRARAWASEADWYWTVIDPAGVGFFGLFLPTAYCGGFLLNFVRQFATEWRFDDQGDLDRYLGLAADYARLIDQMRVRTVGQAGRGMLLPRPQAEQAIGLLGGFRAQARPTWEVAPARLMAVRGEAFRIELARRIDTIERTFDEFVGIFSDRYLANAPDTVGIGQYPGGAAIYAELVKLHTTLDLTPDQVHDIGHRRMEGIEGEMASIRTSVGFAGTAKAFQATLDQDARWRAETAPGVATVFQRYIDRMAARFGDYFASGAQATHGVAPLPEALQASMTFGYYDAPKPNRRSGTYLFNSANLTKAALYNIGALTYHELVPGHHLHLATQGENETLHPFRACSFVNAYNEGWAEYAATLAGEMGMYPEPEERYGRLVMDAFLTCRLVVDTGMNALGWSLEQAREYLRAHSAMSETEIRTETLRYSCDIPGQSLAYKMGDTAILALRDRMRRARGDRFDIKQFHAAVLGPGGLPLPDLDWHLQVVTARLTG
jgi:uncharacterized protein (DUF885 family)